MEFKALANLPEHPNIIKFLGCVSIEEKLCFLTSYYEKGSLDKLHHVEDDDMTSKDR